MIEFSNAMTNASDSHLRPSVRGALIRQSVLGGSFLYAVLDSAQGKSAVRQAVEFGCYTASLYAGRLGALLDDVAPHLVALELQSPLLEWWLERAGRNYGILLQSKASFDELRKHFRRFLMVKNEAGKKYRFRFYDPRILRAFLPVCTQAELEDFFGPVRCYYTPDRTGTSVLAFSLERGTLTTRRLGENGLCELRSAPSARGPKQTRSMK